MNQKNNFKKAQYLQVRLTPKMKSEVEEVLDKLGLSTTQAVKLYFSQIIMQKAIPFKIEVPEKVSNVDLNEEKMIKESLENYHKGNYTVIDMKDKKKVKKYFNL